jgi:hypothetical protein
MQPISPQPKRRLLKDKKAASPAISTVILTGATIVLVLVAMSYANDFLGKRMAENEFSANRQFMLTTGLQIDDIAWTVGRTQTVLYTSQYGNMQFQPLALNYTFEVNDGAGWATVFAVDTGMIMFNMPVNMYSLGNGYFSRVSTNDDAYVHNGSSAPVTNVFCIEKLPMPSGNCTRVVAVPNIRMLNSTITGLSGVTNYYKFYLPTLVRGYTSYANSQSITLIGNDIIKQTVSPVNQVRINVTYPNGVPPSTEGFGSDFFRFDHQVDPYQNSQVFDVTDGSVVEFYIGKITVSVGQV